MNKAILIVLILIAAVLAGAAYYYFVVRPKSQSGGEKAGEITSFEVIEPNLVLKGKNLSKVEIWAIPTGTGITEENYSKLGEAVLSGTDNNEQTWDFPIPTDPILATDIFARAYDLNNQKVGDKSLPFTGATDIYNALWGAETNEADITIWDNTRTFSYAVTERFTIRLNGDQYPQNNLSVTPVGIIGEVSNVPSVNPPDYVKRYEAVKVGKVVIKNNDFQIDVYVYNQNAANIEYNNTQYGFSFSLPAKDILSQDNIGYEFVTNNSLARVDLPRNDFIDTNLGEAAFIVGVSRNDQTISNCLKLSAEEQKQDDDQSINGTNFKVFEGTGAGAGNLYETKSFRTVYNNSCFEAVLLLHSGNIGNYSPGAVREFDKTKAMAGLEEILNTFKVKQ